jgi:hypothetical protein
MRIQPPWLGDFFDQKVDERPNEGKEAAAKRNHRRNVGLAIQSGRIRLSPPDLTFSRQT